MLEGLAPDDLDRVVDRRWDPPVTLGVRLVSVADDSLQHLGQAAYVRGLLGYEPYPSRLTGLCTRFEFDRFGKIGSASAVNRLSGTSICIR